MNDLAITDDPDEFTYRDEDEPIRDEAVDLLQRVLELITAHPEVHDQTDWIYVDHVPGDQMDSNGTLQVMFDPQRPSACGTKGCLAGNAVIMSNLFPLRLSSDPSDDELYLVEFRHQRQWRVIDSYVQGLAARLLHLTEDEADELFEGGNSVDDLWRIASEITQGRVRRPETV